MLSHIEHFALQGDGDVLQVGWYLEVEDAITTVLELDVLKVLRNRDRVDVACGCQRHLRMLDQLVGGESAIDLQLRLDDD